MANQNDSTYVNGIATTKNGYSGLGLFCKKGQRLYNIDAPCPIFFKPDDSPSDERWEMITEKVCQDILPYYAVSTHGRIMNVYSGKIMKPNYRTNGYEYYCLSAKNCKNGQKKYNTHRIVLKTFQPREDMDELQVNHIDSIKSHNYIDKIMPDGNIESNLEWSTAQENTYLASKDGLREKFKINMDDAIAIRKLHHDGLSYNDIMQKYYPNISWHTIQNVCRNKVYYDKNYIPEKHNYSNDRKLNDRDANIIRELFAQGYTYKTIKEKFYPDIAISTLSDIVRGVTHKSNFI